MTEEKSPVQKRKKRKALEREEREIEEEILWMRRAARLEEIYLLNSKDMLAQAKLKTTFVIDQAIPEAGIAFIAGPPGSNKSWLAYEAAICLARGEPWLVFETPKKGRVLVLNYDNPSTEVARRFLRLGMRATDDIHFHSIAAKLPPEGLPAILRLPDNEEQLMMIIGRLKPDLIIVDSMRQSHTGEEVSSRDMGRVMACFRGMTSWGAAVLIVHHFRKSQTDKKKGKVEDDQPMRGNVEIEASSDAIMFSQDGVLEIKKTRGWVPTITKCEYSVEDSECEECVCEKCGGEGRVDDEDKKKKAVCKNCRGTGRNQECDVCESTGVGPTTTVTAEDAMDKLIAVLKENGPLTSMGVQKALGLDRQGAIGLITRARRMKLVRDAPRKTANSPKGAIELTDST